MNPHDPSTSPDPRSGLVLLVAPARSYRVASYQQACERLGYRLLVVSDSRHSLVSAIAQGITVDFDDPAEARRKVLEGLGNHRVVSVLATDDRVVGIASALAEELGLPHNAADSALLTRRKDLARQRLREAGCRVPRFRVLALDEIPDQAEAIPYPAVIKPLMLSGSRGVMRVNHPVELIDAAQVLREILQDEAGDDFERSHCLVEDYLEGEEIAFDGFVQNGRLLPLALFDKPEPMTGPCFEESCYITPSRLPGRLRAEIFDEIERCCRAYGLSHGPIHAEARLSEQGVVLLEMASRTIGGQCGGILEFVLGEPLEDLVLKLACGAAPPEPKKGLYAGVMMIPIPQAGLLKRVEGLLEARRTPQVSDIEIHIQPGYELVPLPRGSSYLGFIFAQSESYDETWQALRRAHARLRFVTRPKWDLTPA